MTLPGIVIAGAPKCATTSLFRWLSDHPEICPSLTKETCYLVDRESPLLPGENVHTHGIEGYAGLFAHCPPGSVGMEATPDYIDQITPPWVLASLDPRPLVVFVLRDPAVRLLSAYKFYAGHKAALPAGMGFAAYAEALLAGRTFGGRLGPLVSGTLAAGHYALHLQRWAGVMGREALSIHSFEAMVRDPSAFMNGLCQKLGLDPSPFGPKYDFLAKNMSYGVRSKVLHRLRNTVADRLPEGFYRRLTSRVYRWLNYDPGGYRLTDEDRRALKRVATHYAPGNRELGKLFDLDVSDWEKAWEIDSGV
ncbi:sulfotransferase domain-containing protein [Desulfovibrio ferrophilus]|uniref:Sulfotransferase family protein n=1 Tax=Desulfovibrio ferrophilus TaxID=241368 RepID=A0A2Z6B163_9BACT|nr:sulfotransferase domain-containing protein [Desulfovibrio ferrophilus]BBD09267.1 sulfotransferase family protein [Desulfovibrio ferrophilus]